jgi:hypothetical protein
MATLAAPRSLGPKPAAFLKFIPQSDLAVIDRISCITRNHDYRVFDTLFGMDARYHIQPQMIACPFSGESGSVAKAEPLLHCTVLPAIT